MGSGARTEWLTHGMTTPGLLGSHLGGRNKAQRNPFREAQPEVGIPKKAIDRKGPMAQHRSKNG